MYIKFWCDLNVVSSIQYVVKDKAYNVLHMSRTT